MNCIFCQIISGKSESHVLFEDADTIAFLDINPFSLGHTLVSPKEHISELIEVPDELLRKLFSTVKHVSRSIRVSLSADGINYGINEGEAANQIVPHIHVHIIPRKQKDDVSFRRRLSLSNHELKSIRDTIAQNLKSKP